MLLPKSLFRKKPVFLLHLAVFLFGFAGLLGKLITESPVVIVFGRTFLAAGVLFLVLVFRRESLAVLRWQDAAGFIGMLGAQDSVDIR